MHKKAFHFPNLLRFAFLLPAFAWLSPAIAPAAEFDALYLHDGSVLKGTIIRSADGDYIVYSELGELGVESSRVLHALERETTPPVISETHILMGGSTETLTLTEKEVPARAADDKAPGIFRFIVAGAAASVVNETGDEIQFQTRNIGANSVVEIDHANIPAETRRLQIGAWRFDLLTASGKDRTVFTQNYTAERAGTGRVIVNFPKTWQVEDVSPPPDVRRNGLLLWRKPLARQQQFTPKIVFQK